MSNNSLAHHQASVNGSGSNPLTDTVPTHTDPSCIVSPWNQVNPPSGHDLRVAYFGNDVGAGEMLESVYSGRVLFDGSTKVWYLWNGHYWQSDDCGAIHRTITKQLPKWFSAAMFRSRDERIDAKGRADNAHDNGAKAEYVKEMQAAAEAEKMFRDATAKYSKLKNIDNAMTVLQRLVKVGGDIWDRNNYQIACTNGTVEVSAQGVKFRAGRPEDYNRTVAGVRWLGLEEKSPLWDRVVCEVMSNDEGKAEYIMSVLGYATLGLSEQHIFPCLVGEGRNGKGVVLEAVQKVLGGYAHVASEDLVILKNKGTTGAATPDIAALQGKRLVWVDETREGARLNVSQMKNITGGGELTGRFLYSNAVPFKSVATIFLLTNHKPHIPANDYAAWRRVKAIEFNETYVDNPTQPNERKIDVTIPDRLKAEYSGILASLAYYAHLYLKEGRVLPEPDKVKMATGSYRDGEDTVLEFVSTQCVKGDTMRVPCNQMYSSYRTWVENNGYGKPMSSRSFADRIRKMGYGRTGSKSKPSYIGIGLSA